MKAYEKGNKRNKKDNGKLNISRRWKISVVVLVIVVISVGYIFSCLFSKGVNGGIVLDAEFELFLYKVETGEMDSFGEKVENFIDIFIP